MASKKLSTLEEGGQYRVVQTGNERRIAIKVRKQLEGKKTLFTFQGCKKR